jgi:hypothetical protein
MQCKWKNEGCDRIAINSAWRRRKRLLAQIDLGWSIAISLKRPGRAAGAFRIAALSRTAGKAHISVVRPAFGRRNGGGRNKRTLYVCTR